MVAERPRATRTRLRREIKKKNPDAGKITADIAILYQKPIEDWDWEELSRGRCRGADGSFQGDKPKWITPAVVAEAQRRMRGLTQQELMTHAKTAIDTLVGLMQNDEVNDWGNPLVSAGVKLNAAQYVLNHVIGMPTQRVEMDTHNPLAELMGAILVNPDGEPSHIIVEGQVIDPSEEGDDE